MKTAISIPNDVFTKVNQMARSRKMSRSALFTIAAADYIERHRRDDVTRRLNEVYSKEDSALDPALARLQAASLPKEDW